MLNVALDGNRVHAVDLCDGIVFTRLAIILPQQPLFMIYTTLAVFTLPWQSDSDQIFRFLP